jgi:hypothetical protein
MGITRRMWSLVLILGLLGLVLVSAGEAAQFNWQQFKGTQSGSCSTSMPGRWPSSHT